MQHLDEVKNIVSDVLQLGDRGAQLNAQTPMLGSMPELDSIMVVSLITALEDHFGITVEDDEISAETFETLGSLSQFVEHKLAA